jgi:hypothetical protein
MSSCEQVTLRTVFALGQLFGEKYMLPPLALCPRATLPATFSPFLKGVSLNSELRGCTEAAKKEAN